MSERTPRGLRIGAIEVICLMESAGYASLEVRVGSAVLSISATPKGQKAWLLIEDEKGTRRGINIKRAGHWLDVKLP